jgi:hypothetical protein
VGQARDPAVDPGRRPLRALAAAIHRPDADARVALAGSQLVGLAMARYVVRLEPLASMSPDEVAAEVGPTVERYLYGPRGVATER